MLSIEDILKELGRNVYVKPLDLRRIQHSSIDLTLSKYCWSLSQKRPVYDSNRQMIILEPHDHVIAYTSEAIHLSNKVAGICTSLVSNCKLGINPISTNVDPNYTGFLLIILHNITNKTIELPLGHPIVSIQLFYLSTPVRTTSTQISANHEALLREALCDDSLVNEFRNYTQKNGWSTKREEMITEYNKSDQQKTIRDYISLRRKSLSIWYRVVRSKAAKYALLIMLLLIVFILIQQVTLQLCLDSPELIATIVSVIVTIIANDIMKEN